MRERLFLYLPYPFKIAAASVEAVRLQRWRYGTGFEGRVRAAAERDGWPPDQWRSWQQERLSDVLQRAATSVPRYQRLWTERGVSKEDASWRDLANWPLLTKGDIRAQPQGLRASGLPRPLFSEHTSGSTGTPLTLLFTRRCLHEYYAIYEQRVRRWNDVNVRTPWAILGGRLVAHPTRAKPPYWVWNSVSRQLYLSSYHLSARTVSAYATALSRHGVEYVLGYPSALYSLAALSREMNVPLPQMRVIVANAEPVLSYHRDAIESAFNAPLRSTYGMSEMVLAASECPRGTMHLWPEVGFLEVLDAEGHPTPPGRPGRVVATSLLNLDTPLIRYETGDSIIAAPPDESCSCGRSLPLLGTVEGRLDDVIVSPDGRHIGRLDPVFKADLPVVEAQIEQTGPATLRVRVVPALTFRADDAESIRERIRNRVGPMEVEVEVVDHIPRTAAGKFRAVVGWRPSGASPSNDNDVAW